MSLLNFDVLYSLPSSVPWISCRWVAAKIGSGKVSDLAIFKMISLNKANSIIIIVFEKE